MTKDRRSSRKQGRTCGDCGREITDLNKSGYCQQCWPKHVKGSVVRGRREILPFFD